MRSILARLRGAWAWARRRAGLNAPGWPTPAQDDTQTYYRTQYERLVGVLPTLPRGQSHPRANERREVLLAFAQILEGLHNYGDNPVMPPGIRRMVVREPALSGVRAFAGSAPGFIASLMPYLPMILIVGGLLMVTGWGGSLWNGWRADRAEARADRNHDIAEWNYDQWQAAHNRATERLEALGDAQRLAQETATAWTAERRARDRAAARERRRQSEIANVLADSPEPPAWRLRDDSPAEDSTAGPTDP